MATTTNFGWTTPDDTALVKDGAAAIRTLGSSIDTSFLDLKGGTTGQVLAKNSNTDLDFTWSSDQVGIPASIVDAKGDLIAATAADTVSRVAVGTNGQVLTADSTAATGVAWATASSGGMTLLSTTTLSGTATTISSISGSYTNLFIMISGVNQSANGGLILNPNGASNLVSWVNADSTGGTGGQGSSTLVSLPLTGAQSDLLASQTDNSFACQINNYASAASVKTFQSYGRFRKAATPTYAAVIASGGIATSSAISSIQITTTGGSATHSAGTVLIYGVK